MTKYLVPDLPLCNLPVVLIVQDTSVWSWVLSFNLLGIHRLGMSCVHLNFPMHKISTLPKPYTQNFYHCWCSAHLPQFEGEWPLWLQLFPGACRLTPWLCFIIFPFHSATLHKSLCPVIKAASQCQVCFIYSPLHLPGVATEKPVQCRVEAQLAGDRESWGSYLKTDV